MAPITQSIAPKAEVDHAQLPWRARLYQPDAAAEAAPEVRRPDSGGPQITTAWTLCTVYREWFRKYVLPKVKKVAPGTIQSYDESFGKWEKFTGDPPIYEIDGNEEIACQFLDGLDADTYRRGPRSLPKPLSADTIAKHVTQVGALLRLLEPRFGRRGPYLGIIERAPLMSRTRPRKRPKKPIDLDVARRVFACCGQMTTPRKWTEPGQRWSALIAVLFYTGLRIGTAKKLRSEWLIEDDGEYWLDIPATEAAAEFDGRGAKEERVVKTKESLLKFLRTDVAEMLLALPTVNGRFFPAQRTDYLRDRHERLQALAGIKQPFGFHAWRRTHGVIIDLLCGAKDGIEGAQKSLDHKEGLTTRSHYVGLHPEYFKRMPSLRVAPKGFDPNQKTLF